MYEEIRKQEAARKHEAAEIVHKVLKLLESENLTVRDAELILLAAKDVLMANSLVSVPECAEWSHRHGTPMMVRHRRADKLPSNIGT